MTTQLIRSTRAIIGAPGEDGAEIDGLRINFEVVKQDGQTLNTAKIRIYNPAPTTIALATRKEASIQLYAGYGGAAGLIFLGTITRCVARLEGVDRIMEIESGDGQAGKAASVSTTLGGQSTLKEALGPLGDLAGAALDFAGVDADAPLAAPRGLTLSGPVYGAVNRIARLNRLDWTIEDGRIVLTKRGEATTLPALLVSPATGLIGSPSPSSEGGLELRMLLNPEARLRRIIRLESREYTGWYLLRRLKHFGDSGWATEYYTEVEASEIKPRRAA